MSDRRWLVMSTGLLVPAMVGVLGLGAAWGQQPGKKAAGKPTAAAPKAAATAPGQSPQELVVTAVPVNPTDAIAKVNGEVISRQELANACVERYGSEVLETLVARKLVEQAMKSANLSVTAQEIDNEIDRIAAMSGVGREAYLRMLAKERNVSPAQYAKNIIYPSLALKKMAAPRVQVTPKDLEEAYEAQFGEKLRCRMILVDTQRKAIELWNELRTNPGGFAKVAQEKSMDQATRALGGLLTDPISRHANPRNVSDPAFEQLVDGDPKDKDPSHKPKDGDITGPIQVSETAWVLLRREALEPGTPYDKNDKDLAEKLTVLIRDAKLNAEVEKAMQELVYNSEIDNRLTGQMKLAKEDQRPEAQVDGQVKRMSKPDEELAPGEAAAAEGTAAPATPSKPSAPPVGAPAAPVKPKASATTPAKR